MQAFASPCDMAMDAEHMVMMDGESAAEDDCCNDAATFAKTGQPCKVGQSCQTSGLALLMLPFVSESRLADWQPRITLPTFRSFSLAQIWRPPAFN